MPNRQTHISQSAALAPFIRAGIDGGCTACLRPIADHVDNRGQWLGCRGAREDVPMILIADRRGGVLAPRAATSNDLQTVESTTPHVRHTPASTPARTRATRTTPARATGPQVVYIARFPVTHNAIERLPPHDRKVYGLIARMRGKGATRALLLEIMDATKATGRVDGAVRRLRLKKVIQTRSIVE